VFLLAGSLLARPSRKDDGYFSGLEYIMRQPKRLGADSLIKIICRLFDSLEIGYLADEIWVFARTRLPASEQFE
jgi:hypothetical protein